MLDIGAKVIPGQYITQIFGFDKKSGLLINYLTGPGTTIYHVEGQQISKKIPIVVATRVGLVKTREVSDDAIPEDFPKDFKSKDPIKHILVYVLPNTGSYVNRQVEFDGASLTTSSAINLPRENDVVLVRILRISQKQATCELLAVEGHRNILQDSGLGSNGDSAHFSVPPGGGSQSISSYQSVASSQSTSINAVAFDLGETYRGIIRSQDIRSTDRDKVKLIDSFKPGDIVRAIVISLGDGSNYYLSTARDDLGVVFARSEGGSGNIMYPVDWQHMIDSKTGTLEMRKAAKPFV